MTARYFSLSFRELAAAFALSLSLITPNPLVVGQEPDGGNPHAELVTPDVPGPDVGDTGRFDVVPPWKPEYDQGAGGMCHDCYVRYGRHCLGHNCVDPGWHNLEPIPWQMFGQGEYVGPARLPHVPEYRLRPDDRLELIYRLTRERNPEPYRIQVGDTFRLESLTAPELNREVVVQPDGAISAAQLGQVVAAGKTLEQLVDELDELYRPVVREASLSILPLEIDTRLEELRATVDRRAGSGGQSLSVRVTPEGTIQMPAIGSVPVQGLTLDELGREVEARYSEIVYGLGVTPILAQRAPRYVHVLGEVVNPGRFTLEGPTTLMQALAMAGSWNVGANLREVVVFRRDENWCLMAVKLNIRPALFGRSSCPDAEIWIRDSDVIVVPQSDILIADNIIELFFTRGVYAVLPFSTNYSFNRTGIIIP